ncbi:D-3-phosphoglycerate dehydrogenase [Methanococcoides methylutens]|uniref:D-3-phosphoglycerate dehydrogenase n=1 Tax=Methanococcoides methylutens TaxID=2226 RepID=A0A099T3M1_METMT|nr:phosphoglycerate dehydrogenase [Methanococcoides methylutens]KGK99469.1 D-3-phosphoglycerate dehydrogenase [Methanococcoides methylutens]
MKVLVSDSLSEEGVSKLQEHFDVDVSTGLSEDELVEKIVDFDALVIRSGTQVTRRVIEAADNLKIVGRAGVGVDNIDIDAATEKGIIVVNAPEGNMLSAAEHTIAMMMSMARNIPQANASLKAKKWERKNFMGVEVNGKTLGVIGLGRIGAEVAKRAQGMEMDILAYDPFITEDRAKAMGVELTTVDDIAKRADFITVHTPLTKETRNILDTAQFDMMKSSSRVINCARGGIINEEALADALKAGKITGAAIDVFTSEPPFDCPFIGLDNVIVTPHLGASTEEAQVNVAVSVAEEIISVLNGGSARNTINIPAVKPEVMAVLAPYIGLAETLGSAVAQLLDTNYDKIEISYKGEISEKDTRAVTVAAVKGVLEVALGSTVNYVNAPALAKGRDIEVMESKSETSDEYASTISIKLFQDSNSRSVTGAVVGGEPKIITINGQHVDLVPKGFMIVSNHINRPNVIGPCCMVLGDNGINISGMQVGRVEVGGQTIMALNVDTEVSENVLDEIRGIDGILDATLVTL